MRNKKIVKSSTDEELIHYNKLYWFNINYPYHIGYNTVK